PPTRTTIPPSCATATAPRWRAAPWARASVSAAHRISYHEHASPPLWHRTPRPAGRLRPRPRRLAARGPADDGILLLRLRPGHAVDRPGRATPPALVACRPRADRGDDVHALPPHLPDDRGRAQAAGGGAYAGRGVAHRLRTRLAGSRARH